MPHELAIIGAGNMAEAIARGLLRGKTLSASKIVAIDPSPARRDIFSRELQIESSESLTSVIDASMILLSVKPQTLGGLLNELRTILHEDALLISIIPGFSTATIEQSLAPKTVRVIRTMPNTPMLIGAGVVGMAAGSRATRDDLKKAEQLFSAAAKIVRVSEDKLDAVTAVSGSGPAYFFLLVEQMIRAGIELGLTESEAKLLATQTAFGAGKMLAESADSPQELRRKVTSPNGTTHAAITHMESAGLPKMIVDALRAAARRSAELGRTQSL